MQGGSLVVTLVLEGREAEILRRRFAGEPPSRFVLMEILAGEALVFVVRPEQAGEVNVP